VRTLGASAVSGDGLQDGIGWVVDAVRRSRRARRLTDNL